MALKDTQREHNSLYTLEHMVQAVDSHDSQMKGLRHKLNSASDPQQRENIQRAIDKRHRQNVGLFLHNQQSANAFLDYERNPEQFESILKDIEKQFSIKPGERSTDIDYAVMQDTASYKSQQRKTQDEKASDAAIKPISDVLGDFELKLAELAEKFPRVAIAAEGSAIELSVIAAGGFAKGGYDLLTGRQRGAVQPPAQ